MNCDQCCCCTTDVRMPACCMCSCVGHRQTLVALRDVALLLRHLLLPRLHVHTAVSLPLVPGPRQPPAVRRQRSHQALRTALRQPPALGGAAAPAPSLNGGGGGGGSAGGSDDEMKRAAAALVAELTASGDPKAILEAMAALPQVLLIVSPSPSGMNSTAPLRASVSAAGSMR